MSRSSAATAITGNVNRVTARNPTLVVVSITPFGSDGPKARWLATDLTIAAAGGQMALNGDRDRAPVRMSNRQAWLNASLDAAVAALVALHERNRSGVGQRADISAQQSMIVCTQFQMMHALVGPDEVVRIAGGVELGPFTLQFVHGCLDGQVTVSFLFGQMIGPFTSRLFRWMHEEGACDESLATKDWIGFFARVIDGTEPPSELARGNAAIAAFVATRTKDELLAAALERSLLIAPITTTSDVLALGQLRDRGYWEDVEGVKFPGSIAKLSVSPLGVLGRPPRLGEHTDEVRAEPRRTPSAPPPADPPPAGRPLDGVKVLDFMWAFAGPYATRILADHGATVVKIETSHKVDVLRVVAPWNDPSQSVESALQYHSLNAGKLGLALDLSKPGGRDVVFDLVRWADVVTERAPHGAYPTAGDDRWIAIAVETDEQWQALCTAASLPPDLAPLDTSARMSRQDNLDALLSAWTARARRRGPAGVAAAAGRAGAPSAERPPVCRRPATRAPGSATAGHRSPDGRPRGEDQPPWPLLQEKSSRAVLVMPLVVCTASTSPWPFSVDRPPVPEPRTTSTVPWLWPEFPWTPIVNTYRNNAVPGPGQPFTVPE